MSVIENWVTSHPADIVLVAEYRENCLNHGKEVSRDNLEQSLAEANLEDVLVTKERCAKSMGLEELHNNIEVAFQQIESYAWPLSLLDDLPETNDKEPAMLHTQMSPTTAQLKHIML